MSRLWTIVHSRKSRGANLGQTRGSGAHFNVAQGLTELRLFARVVALLIEVVAEKPPHVGEPIEGAYDADGGAIVDEVHEAKVEHVTDDQLASNARARQKERERSASRART